MDRHSGNVRLVQDAVARKCAHLEADPFLVEHVLATAKAREEARKRQGSAMRMAFALVMITFVAVALSLPHRQETAARLDAATQPEDEYPAFTDVSARIAADPALAPGEDAFLDLSAVGLPTWSDCCAAGQGILLYEASRIFLWNGEDAELTPIEVPPSISFERLFSNERGLFALSRQGTLYAVRIREGRADFEEIAQVPLALDDQQIDKAMLDGETLFLLISNPFDMAEVPARTLLACDLVTGKLEQRLTAQPILDAACGRAGELLLLTKRDDGQVVVERLGPERGDRTVIAEWAASGAAGLAYHAETDTVYAACAGSVYRVEQGKEPNPCAYLPQGSLCNTSFAVLTADGRYCLHHDDAVYLRALSEGYAPQEPLMIANMTFDYYGRDGFRAFQWECAYPAAYATAQYAAAEDYLRDFLFGDAADVYAVSDPAVFSTLMEKGYCVDLSGSEVIAAYVARMYPGIRDAFCRDGGIWAIPFITGFDFRFALGYNPRVLEMIGLTEADLPRDFMEWMAFLEAWADSPVLEENNMDLVRASLYGDLRELLLMTMLEQQAMDCDRRGLPPTFTSEAFTALLNKLEELTPLLDALDAASRQNAPYREWDDTGSALFITDYQLFTGDGNSLMNGGCKLWSIGLEPDSPAAYPLRLTLLFVNAQTEKEEIAVALLERLLADLDDATRLALFPDENEGVEMEYYRDYLAQYEAETQPLAQQLALCDDPLKRQELTERMDEITAKWAETLKYRYDISPESIAEYRAIGERVVPYSNLVQVIRGTDSLQSAYSRYLDGQSGTAEFIGTLERVLRYMESENPS